MIKDLDIVELVADLPDKALRAGTIGTVVFDYGKGDAYEVEFFDRAGNTIDVAFVTCNQIRKVSPTEAERKLDIPKPGKKSAVAATGT